jgi:hypothetical protein
MGGSHEIGYDMVGIVFLQEAMAANATFNGDRPDLYRSSGNDIGFRVADNPGEGTFFG